jgi:hypothetical protein
MDEQVGLHDIVEEAETPEVNLHTNFSSYREMLLEHLFSGEIMRQLWLTRGQRIELLKPQVDDSGYDLVLEMQGIVRHVQLKASHLGSATSRQSINIALAQKPSGCIVWIRFQENTLELGPFLWFGGAPGEPLPDLSSYPIATHAKANAQGIKTARPRIRSVPRTAFAALPTIEAVVTRLFGDMKNA